MRRRPVSRQRWQPPVPELALGERAAPANAWSLQPQFHRIVVVGASVLSEVFESFFKTQPHVIALRELSNGDAHVDVRAAPDWGDLGPAEQ